MQRAQSLKAHRNRWNRMRPCSSGQVPPSPEIASYRKLDTKGSLTPKRCHCPASFFTGIEWDDVNINAHIPACGLSDNSDVVPRLQDRGEHGGVLFMHHPQVCHASCRSVKVGSDKPVTFQVVRSVPESEREKWKIIILGITKARQLLSASVTA